MRRRGDLHQAEAENAETRVELFYHLRAAIDVLEQIVLQPKIPPTDEPLQENLEKPVRLPPEPPPERLTYTIKEVLRLTGVGRSRLYQAIKKKQLRAVKFNNRTLIKDKDLRAWLDGLPEYP